IGTSPATCFAVLALEVVLLQLVGIVVGVFAGTALSAYFGCVGIRFAGFEEAAANAFMSPVVHPQIHLDRIIQSVITVVLITCPIGILPALKVVRMNPVTAIYHS